MIVEIIRADITDLEREKILKNVRRMFGELVEEIQNKKQQEIQNEEVKNENC